MLQLPNKKTTPKVKFEEYSMLIFGEKKIGKTSLCAQFPDSLLLFFEPGGKSLNCYQLNVENWEDFLDLIRQLKNNEHNFKNIVIDTIDIAYKLCFKNVCQKLNIQHPSDKRDFGKSWGLIKEHFHDTIMDLFSTRLGLIFISHSEEKLIETESGKTYNVIEPTANKNAKELICGIADSVFYYHWNKNERQLLIEGNELISVGTRCDFAFFDKNNGEKLKYIKMGKSPEESYKNLIDAFNNKYTNSPPEKKRKVFKMKVKKQ